MTPKERVDAALAALLAGGDGVWQAAFCLALGSAQHLAEHGRGEPLRVLEAAVQRATVTQEAVAP